MYTGKYGQYRNTRLISQAPDHTALWCGSQRFNAWLRYSAAFKKSWYRLRILVSNCHTDRQIRIPRYIVGA
jgi:hypothetical protein